MNDSSRMKLQSVLSSMGMDADSLAVQLEDYHKKISRLEKEVRELANSFSESDALFSPRKDHFPSEELKHKKEELSDLTKEYDELKKHYDYVNNNIDVIVDVLSHELDGNANKNGLLYQEQDRQRIARDLHEIAILNLSYLAEKIDQCISILEKDPKKVKMDLMMAKNNLNSTIDNIRSVVYDLRPMDFDSLDFRKEILDFIHGFNSDNQYQIDTDIEDITCNDQLVLKTIFLIIKECFQNIKKHAEAFSIHLIVQEQIGMYYIYVEDDGKGFDVKKSENINSHFGLSMMKERVSLLGGNISIISSDNAGTKIKILIPIPR